MISVPERGVVQNSARESVTGIVSANRPFFITTLNSPCITENIGAGSPALARAALTIE